MSTELGGQNNGGQGGSNTGAGNQAPAGGGAAPNTGNPGSANGAGASGGNTGAGGQSWLDTLPPEYKENASIKGFKSVEDLAKSYIHAQGMIGAEKIVIPGKQSTDQDWEGVFAKLGRPESPDKYELKASESHDPEFIKSFKEAAHKSGLLPKQVEGLYGFYNEVAKKQQENLELQMKKEMDDGIANLRKEWPDSEYEKNLGVAKNAVNTFLGEEGKKWLNESGMGNNPMMIKFMHKIGLAMGEDSLKGGGGVSFNEGRESAQSKLNAIMGDSKHPYFDSSHPNHKAAVQEVGSYYSIISKK